MARPANYIRVTAINEYYSADFIVTQAKSLAAIRKVRRNFCRLSENGIWLSEHKKVYDLGLLSVTTTPLGRHTKRPIIK